MRPDELTKAQLQTLITALDLLLREQRKLFTVLQPFYQGGHDGGSEAERGIMHVELLKGKLEAAKWAILAKEKQA